MAFATFKINSLKLLFFSLSLMPFLLVSDNIEFNYKRSEGYLWQRTRNEKCNETLKAFADWKIYALTAEYCKQSPVYLKPIKGTIPVIRLDNNSWQQAKFHEKLSDYIATLPPGEIQLDCDVPESKLLKYGKFLCNLKKKLSNHHFSITILPCHLKHAELRAVTANVIYVVLQLHGLHTPKDLPNRYKLFDIDEAQHAVFLIEKLQIPYKIALPSYAYMIHYHKNGKFRRLSSEATIQHNKAEIKKLSLPTWSEVIAFRKANKNVAVIWFRLPYPGDRFALEEDNLKRLENNNLPRVGAETTQCKNGNITQIFWKNNGCLGYPLFSQKLNGYGETFLYNSIISAENENIPGKVPHQICGPLPPPGTKVLVAEIIQWRTK